MLLPFQCLWTFRFGHQQECNVIILSGFLFVQNCHFREYTALTLKKKDFYCRDLVFNYLGTNLYLQSATRWGRLRVVPIFPRDSRASETGAGVKIISREKDARFARSTIPEEKWGLLVVYRSLVPSIQSWGVCRFL